MKTYALIGIILIVAGIAAFAYQGIDHTFNHNAVDPSPMRMTAESIGTLPLPLVAGALAFVGGITLLFTGSKKNEDFSKRQFQNRRWLR